MNKNKILLIILLTILATIVVFFVTSRKTFPLVSPQSSSVPSVVPSASSYNPPKEIHYSGSTNLKEELDSINPQVLESDFEELKN